MLDISVIIVSWNAKEYLSQCLDSLKDPCGFTQEVIVVDNGSSDGSAEFVEKEFSHVRLIKNEENLGFAKANNIGIKASSGRYLCLVNSDVIVLDRCIKNLVDFMDTNPDTAMSGPKILNSDRTLQPSCRHFPSIWNNTCQIFGLNKIFPNSAFFSEPFMKYWQHDQIRDIDVLTGCFWMLRRESLEEVGLLDENFFIYGEDVDWCKRFKRARWRIMFYPDSQAIHFGGASSANAPIKFYIELQKADMLYWKKHHGIAGQICYRMLISVRHLTRIPFYLVQFILCRSRRKESLSKIKRSFSSVLLALCIKDFDFE